MNDQEKAKHLCDLKICASMGEARRIIMQGAYDHYINKQTKWGRKKTQIKLTWPEMNHELRNNANIKFSNVNTKRNVNLCNEKIFDECLTEVFEIC